MRSLPEIVHRRPVAQEPPVGKGECEEPAAGSLLVFAPADRNALERAFEKRAHAAMADDQERQAGIMGRKKRVDGAADPRLGRRSPAPIP